MRRDHADHRRDDQPIAGGELIQSSQYPDTLRTNADLFVAFAQRSFDYVDIVRIDSSTRKGDLPSMSTQMIGSFGQHEIVTVLAFLDRYQHSGGLVTVPGNRLRRASLEGLGNFFGNHRSETFLTRVRSVIEPTPI